MVKHTRKELLQKLYFAKLKTLQKNLEMFTLPCRNSAANSVNLRQFRGQLVSAFKSRGPEPLICHCNAKRTLPPALFNSKSK